MTKNEAIMWKVIGDILDAIKDAGDSGIPEGHLYATLMQFMSLDTFNGILAILEKGGKITRKYHLIKAI